MNKFNKIKKEIPTCVIYTRVSSKEQVKGFSLESQEKLCRDYAERNGLQVLRLFREAGESAKTADRTELQNLLKYCFKEHKKIGAVVIYKVDRFARNNADYYGLKTYLLKMGIQLKSATEPIGDDISGVAMEGMLAVFAQIDNMIRAEKSTGGMKTKLTKGYWAWRAPLGYKNIIDQAGKKEIVIDTEKAPFIRMIFEEFATGKYSVRELARKIAKSELKTRHNKYMYAQRCNEILRNRFYYGRIYAPKWEIDCEGQHKPLISEALFKKVKDVLNGNANKKPRSRNHPDFPLRGVRCECGGNISGGYSKGRNKLYSYYGCISKECPKRRALAKETFEKDFTEFLQELTPDESEFDALGEAILFAYKHEAGSILESNKQTEKRIANLKEEKEGLIKMKIKNQILDEDYDEHMGKLKNQIMEIEFSKKNLRFEDYDIKAVIKFVFDFLKTLPERWRELEPADLRVLINILFPENVVYKYPKFKTAEIPIVYKRNSENVSEKTRLVLPPGFEPGFSA